MANALIDTNVLVYLYDQNSPSKQDRAKALLNRLQQAGTGRLSTQSLSEFTSIAMRKLDPPLTPRETYLQISLMISTWPIFPLTPQIVLEATRGVRDHQFTYYDAQIWACARLNQVNVVLSEDFQNNQIVEGVEFSNPFHESFDLELW